MKKLCLLGMLIFVSQAVVGTGVVNFESGSDTSPLTPSSYGLKTVSCKKQFPSDKTDMDNDEIGRYEARSRYLAAVGDERRFSGESICNDVKKKSSKKVHFADEVRDCSEELKAHFIKDGESKILKKEKNNKRTKLMKADRWGNLLIKYTDEARSDVENNRELIEGDRALLRSYVFMCAACAAYRFLQSFL